MSLLYFFHANDKHCQKKQFSVELCSSEEELTWGELVRNSACVTSVPALLFHDTNLFYFGF